ncbi:HAMP domain-containing histidine kinase [Rhodocytophaga rosea]|uniref:histidine kinase n=1 Tax=Rhodocytophaga rosea TaxID=2704465 RepID=A0A6C0GKI7_9BACT|nr:HAMP domain-containing sensor histidine kinase [Rhodocytophaga rosea]QHT68150.1 HAMP domain-containing histidine kinase [Rhodocytophaga rosea]
MNKLSDEELINELQQRFSQNKKSLAELTKLTRQLKKVNLKLIEAEKLKTHFLANIRNEMNNPLSSIMGLSRNIHAASYTQPEKIPAMAALIHAEAFDLDFQFRNIFAAAELESGEWPLEIVQTDIVSLVNSLLEMHQHRILSKPLHVQVIQEISSGHVMFQTDPAKLQLVLSNLLANAIEYSHDHGQLKIHIQKENNILSVSIQDFGIGIPPADHEVIFNRFTQLNSGIIKTNHGHGLGLSVTKDLLEILNGQITLLSDTNEGSTFTICVKEFELMHDDFSAHGNEFFFNEQARF